jgi:hypothetical protein
MRDAPDAPVAHYHTPVAHYRYRSNDTVCIAFQTTTDSGYEQILSLASSGRSVTAPSGDRFEPFLNPPTSATDASF